MLDVIEDVLNFLYLTLWKYTQNRRIVKILGPQHVGILHIFIFGKYLL